MSGAELTKKLHGTTDAAVWAEEFIRLQGEDCDPTDFGWVVGWFANAIETGRSFGRDQPTEGTHGE